MRRIELLINQARRDSDNVDFSENRGIPDESFVQWANDAQDKLQSRIISVHSDLFAAEKIVPVVSGQEAYDNPDNIYQGTMFDNIEFSPDGSERGFYPLEEASIKTRTPGVQGNPSRYIPRGKKILLSLVPTGGSIRWNYYKSLPRLDKRRGQVSAVTLNTTNRTITSLTVDPTAFTDEDVEQIQDQGYISVVDKDGEQEMRKIPVDSMDESTGVVTVTSGFVYDEGETITVGSYIVAQKDGSSHSELPDSCERYLIRTMTLKALNKDSSADSVEWLEELKGIEEEILAAFAESNQDVNYVPMTDGDYTDQE